jgi:hypothetical protein
MLTEKELKACSETSALTMTATFLWRAKIKQQTGIRNDLPKEDAAVPITCQIWPGDPQAIYDETGIELRHPHMLHAKADAVKKMRVGDTGTYDGRKFSVAGPPRRFKGSGLVETALVILEEVDF